MVTLSAEQARQSYIDKMGEPLGMQFAELWQQVARLHTDKQNNWPAKRRLTLRNLSQLVNDPTVRRRVEALFAEVEQNAEFIRDWRDRAGAHLNLSFAIDGPSAPAVTPGSRKQVNDVVDGIVAVMNAVSARHNDSESFFRIGTSAGGALCLMYVIDSGLRAEEAREQRLREGKARADDYGPRDI
jgi:hypothetical protein